MNECPNQRNGLIKKEVGNTYSCKLQLTYSCLLKSLFDQTWSGELCDDRYSVMQIGVGFDVRG